MVINPIVGVYIPIIRIPIKGGMTIPNIATFDHGTNEDSRNPQSIGVFSVEWRKMKLFSSMFGSVTTTPPCKMDMEPENEPL